jgi:hypothetical protein
MYKKRRRYVKALILCAALASCLPHAIANNAVKPGGAFPVVDPATQKERDTTRKQILEDELATEVARMAQARAELATAEGMRKPAGEIGGLIDTLRRHEANIESLNNELSRAGAQQKIATSSARKIVNVKVVAPAVVGKYDGYQKSQDQDDDPYDGYAVSNSE